MLSIARASIRTSIPNPFLLRIAQEEGTSIHNQGMTPGGAGVAKTEEILMRYGEALDIERRETSIKITPLVEGGFPIMVYDEGAEAMIAAQRWHTHYDDPLQVAFCALWLLTPFYRVVHETKGGVLVAAWIERYEASGWEGFEPVYFLNPDDEPSWVLAPGEHYQRRYFSQAVVPPPKPYREFCPDCSLDDDGLPPDWRHGSWIVTADEAIGPTLS